jgi:hypothetical protein
MQFDEPITWEAQVQIWPDRVIFDPMISPVFKRILRNHLNLLVFCSWHAACTTNVHE